jgi:hypothetical protein
MKQIKKRERNLKKGMTTCREQKRASDKYHEYSLLVIDCFLKRTKSRELFVLPLPSALQLI